MRFARLIALLLIVTSCGKELTDYRFFKLERQKVAGAMSMGLADEYPVEIGDEIDFCLDRAGNVRFMGTIEIDALLQKASMLDGTLPGEEYRAALEEVAGCIHLGMYYDGRTDTPAAIFTLRGIQLKDNFGVFNAYELIFRFNNTWEIGVREFFESAEFYPYREQLMGYIKKLTDVLLAS